MRSNPNEKIANEMKAAHDILGFELADLSSVSDNTVEKARDVKTQILFSRPLSNDADFMNNALAIKKAYEELKTQEMRQGYLKKSAPAVAVSSAPAYQRVRGRGEKIPDRLTQSWKDAHDILNLKLDELTSKTDNDIRAAHDFEMRRLSNTAFTPFMADNYDSRHAKIISAYEQLKTTDQRKVYYDEKTNQSTSSSQHSMKK